MLNKEEQTAELLQKKPQRQTGRRLTLFLVLPGVIIILGVVLAGAWQVYRTHNAPSSTGSPAQTRGGTGNGGTSNSQVPGQNYPDVYWQTLRAQFAQGLHMTEQQVKDNLQAFLTTQTPTNRGTVALSAATAAQWLSGLAGAEGISQSQMHALEVTAVQHAYAVLVEQHVLTQQQANEAMQGMNQDDLNTRTMSAFAICTQRKASCQG
jgi:hypothetical protein